MAQSTAFFTAIAQTTATIAGLLVAFRGVQYQLDRQQRRTNTEETRVVLEQLEDQHRDRIADILAALESTFGDHLTYDPAEAHEARIKQLHTVTPPDAFEPAATDRFRSSDESIPYSELGLNQPTVDCLARELNTILWVFAQRTPERDARATGLVTLAEVERLRRSTREASLLYADLVDDIPDKYRQPYWADHSAALFDLADDVVGLTATARHSTLRAASEPERTLALAAGLLAVGVATPVLFLTTPPESPILLSGWELFGAQLSILAGVGVCVLLLLRTIVSRIGGPTVPQHPDS